MRWSEAYAREILSPGRKDTDWHKVGTDPLVLHTVLEKSLGLVISFAKGEKARSKIRHVKRGKPGVLFINAASENSDGHAVVVVEQLPDYYVGLDPAVGMVLIPIEEIYLGSYWPFKVERGERGPRVGVDHMGDIDYLFY